MNKQITPWRAVNDYGIGWLASRFAYEMQVRSGIQALRFPQRPWSENELARWIAPKVPSEPEEYARHWREHRPPFFFQPSNRQVFAERLGIILEQASYESADQSESNASKSADQSGSKDSTSTSLQSLTRYASQIAHGIFSYFSSQTGDLGFPPDWHKNPFNGTRTSQSAHWSRIPMYSRPTGDLKFIWEPARFASAYTLSRTYWATEDESYPETFWQLIESWERQNPPNSGAHWKCGQETSLRIMAWCFALYAFADAEATTPDRLARLVGMIAAQADRVSSDHKYARLQRNNHAISEGVGLWTVGLLFPELRRAGQWRKEGREILTDEAMRQIADDGSYIQNSTNYHRLMLHDYIWAVRLGELFGDPLPDTILKRMECAVEFLYQMQDDETGKVPCYGPNDGALILPLNDCDYDDFRPVLAAGYFLTHRKRLYDHGPWDEDLLWLFGEQALEAPRQHVNRRSFEALDGGYYTLRGERSFAMTRCVTYPYRPAQADMLHFDLWWRGVNVACDPGSYLYFGDPPWNNGLIGTGVHNTISIDGQDQMARGPRFMWFDWSAAEMLSFESSLNGMLERFEGQHHGFERLSSAVIHRRALLRAGDDIWIVVDDILGNGSHTVEGQWLLQPGQHVLEEDHKRLRFRSASTIHDAEMSLYWNVWNVDNVSVDVSCGDESAAPRGWRSRYYGVLEPALSLRLAGSGSIPSRIVWVFVLGQQQEAQRLCFDRETIDVSLDGRQTLSVTLSAIGSAQLQSIKEACFYHHAGVEKLGVL